MYMRLTFMQELKSFRQIHTAQIVSSSHVMDFLMKCQRLIRKTYVIQETEKKNNNKAVQIAKQASQDKAYVIGNIGGIHGGINYTESEEEIKRSFREQLYCLLMEGVDGLILETYYDVHELKTVLEIARE